MKRFYYKKWVRVTAWILCALCFNIAIGSLVGVGCMESAGIYEEEREDVLEGLYGTVLGNYSVLAMTRYESDFGLKELEKTNFRYGVIQTDSLEGLDLNDKSIYDVCNFDRKVTEDMLHIYSCNMGEDTSYQVGKNVFGQYYIYNEGSEQEVSLPVEDYYYVRNSGYLYYLADGKLYPRDLENGELCEVRATDGSLETYPLLQPGGLIQSIQQENGETFYEWLDPSMAVEVDSTSLQLGEIHIVTQEQLEEFGEALPAEAWEEGYEEYSCSRGELHVYRRDYGKSRPYYVLSYMNEPLTTAGNGNYLNQDFMTQLMDWDSQDFFVQMTVLVQWAYSLRYPLYVCLFAGTLLFLVFFGIGMAGAGHRRGDASVEAGAIDRIPFDLLSVIALSVITFLLAVVVFSAEGLTVRLTVVAGIFGILGSELVAALYLQSFSVRLKLGKWWRNTLCYRFCRRVLRFLKKLAEKAVGILHAVPFLWKAWLALAALAVAELFVIAGTEYYVEMELFFWFVEKLALYGVVSVCLLQMKKLQEESERLADGDVDSRVDTSKMLWEFKKHGENLNRIREGIGKAVSEQMKSERFKTELITNVSHDIKTPLTSIINYVDLLEKEDIENPRVQEYLEVLSRQSARLKKLIEDLMEASKASTGNLTVVYESCDVHVMLTQAIGEYEEKLSAGQIELQIREDGEPVRIQADPRHLWRIFDNLMNNICKYAQPGTRAYVNMEREDGCGRIIFRNTSKYALNIGSEELMERFVRGDSSRNTEGNGLGISIAKSLTELMQGKFELVVDGDLFKVIVSFPIEGRDGK